MLTLWDLCRVDLDPQQLLCLICDCKIVLDGTVFDLMSLPEAELAGHDVTGIYIEPNRVLIITVKQKTGDKCSLLAYDNESEEPVGLTEEELKAFLPAMAEFKKSGLLYYKEEAARETLRDLGYETVLDVSSLHRFRKSRDESSPVQVDLVTTPAGKFQLLSHVVGGAETVGLTREALETFITLMEVFEEEKEDD